MSVPGTSLFAGQVLINEVVSNPQLVDWDNQHVPANAQWLELYNPSGGSIALGQWSISTGSGASNSLPSFRAVIPAGSSIPAGGHLALFAYQYGFELRQTPIRLLDGSGNIVDSVSPPSLGADQSYARMPDGSSSWTVSSSPTLNGPNVAPPVSAATPDLQATVFAIQTQLAEPLPPQPTPPVSDDDLPDAFELDGAVKPTRSRKGQPFQELSIAEVRKLPDDSAVITHGTVTMPTGLWDPSRGYIQDGDAGILVHSYNALPLPLGSALTIRGRVHHLHGEVEVAAVKNGEQLAPGGVMPAASPIDPSAIGPLEDALLVTITGRVAGVDRDYATVADDSGSAKVYLYKQLNVTASSLKGQQAVSVTGVVNAEDGQAAGVYRLLPRMPSDIVTDPDAVATQTARPRLPAGARTSGGRGSAAGSAQPESSGAAAAASATAFVTPVLSSSQGGSNASVAAEPSATSGAVLRLDDQPGESRPLWQWIAAGAGVSHAGWRHGRGLRAALARPVASL